MSILTYLLENLSSSLSDFDFMRGDCNVYAVATHRKYDLPIYATVGELDEDDVYGNVTLHVFNKTHDGKYKDVEGEYSAQEMINKSDTDYIKNIKIVPLSEDEAINVFCEDIPDDLLDIYDDEFDDDDMSNNCEQETISKINYVEKHI